MNDRHLIAVSIDALVYEDLEFAKIPKVKLNGAQGKTVEKIIK